MSEKLENEINKITGVILDQIREEFNKGNDDNWYQTFIRVLTTRIAILTVMCNRNYDEIDKLLAMHPDTNETIDS